MCDASVRKICIHISFGNEYNAAKVTSGEGNDDRLRWQLRSTGMAEFNFDGDKCRTPALMHTQMYSTSISQKKKNPKTNHTITFTELTLWLNSHFSRRFVYFFASSVLHFFFFTITHFFLYFIVGFVWICPFQCVHKMLMGSCLPRTTYKNQDRGTPSQREETRNNRSENIFKCLHRIVIYFMFGVKQKIHTNE